LKVLRDFAVPPERAVMVGDSVNDIAAGKAAGMVTIGCTFGYGEMAEIADADYLIDSLPGLLELSLFA
jgi:phosphoglycolate phosphatase